MNKDDLNQDFERSNQTTPNSACHSEEEILASVKRFLADDRIPQALKSALRSNKNLVDFVKKAEVA